MGGSGVQHSSMRLGRLLVDLDFITEDQLQECLAHVEREKSFLAKVLVEQGYISEPKLMLTLVKECKVPHLRLTDYTISEDVVSLIPENVCLRHGMLPADMLGSILTVAMVDPLDTDALDMLRRSFPTVQIKPILCSWTDFKRTAQRLFPDNPAFTHPDFSFNAVRLHQGFGGFGGLTEFGEAALPPDEPIPDALVNEQDAAAPDADPLLSALQEPIRAFIDDAVRSLPQRVSARLAETVPPEISPESVVQLAESALTDALEDALDELQREVERIVAQYQHGTPNSTDELPALLRESFATALRDASPQIVENLRTALPSA